MQNIGKKVFGGIILVFLFIVGLMFSPFAVVEPASKGVVIKASVIQDTVLDSGWHTISPMADVVDINIQTQKEEVQAEAASRDLQTVYTKVALNYHLNPEKVATLYREVGTEFSAKIIAPAIQETIKTTTAKFTAEELVTKREIVKKEIKDSLLARLSARDIIVEDVYMTDFQYSENFNDAIEKKVTAEQNALAAKNKLEEIKYLAEQRIVSARGEAEAIKIQAQAIQSQGGREYVNLKWTEKWNGQLPSTMLGNQGVMIDLAK